MMAVTENELRETVMRISEMTDAELINYAFCGDLYDDDSNTIDDECEE